MFCQLRPAHDVPSVMPPRLFCKTVVEVLIQVLSVCIPRLLILLKIILIDFRHFKALTKMSGEIFKWLTAFCLICPFKSGCERLNVLSVRKLTFCCHRRLAKPLVLKRFGLGVRKLIRLGGHSRLCVLLWLNFEFLGSLFGICLRLLLGWLLFGLLLVFEELSKLEFVASVRLDVA